MRFHFSLSVVSIYFRIANVFSLYLCVSGQCKHPNGCTSDSLTKLIDSSEIEIVPFVMLIFVYEIYDGIFAASFHAIYKYQKYVGNRKSQLLLNFDISFIQIIIFVNNKNRGMLLLLLLFLFSSHSFRFQLRFYSIYICYFIFFFEMSNQMIAILNI